MFYPLNLNEWRQPLQLYKLCPNTVFWPSTQSLLLEYLRGVMESIATKLALYGIKKECARTDTVFLPISEVCNGTVSLDGTEIGPVCTLVNWNSSNTNIKKKSGPQEDNLNFTSITFVIFVVNFSWVRIFKSTLLVNWINGLNLELSK